MPHILRCQIGETKLCNIWGGAPDGNLSAGHAGQHGGPPQAGHGLAVHHGGYLLAGHGLVEDAEHCQVGYLYEPAGYLRAGHQVGYLLAGQTGQHGWSLVFLQLLLGCGGVCYAWYTWF